MFALCHYVWNIGGISMPNVLFFLKKKTVIDVEFYGVQN